MSINSITDRFGKKLNLYAENIDSEALLVGSVSAAAVSASTVNAGEITAAAKVTTPYVHSIRNETFSDTSDVTLVDVQPPLFISGISTITYSSFQEQKYDNVLGVYVDTLKLKVRTNCQVGLPPAANPVAISFKITNIPFIFHNSVLQFGTADFRGSGGTKGSGIGFWTIDTSVQGEIIFVLADDTHINVAQLNAIMNAEIELRSV
jgi:hypothetical protein